MLRFGRKRARDFGFQQGPFGGRSETGLRVTGQNRDREAALQCSLMLAELIQDTRKTMTVKGVLRLRRRSNGNRLGMGICGCILGQQLRHQRSILPYFFDRR